MSGRKTYGQVVGAEGDEMGSVLWVSIGTHPFKPLVVSFWFAVCLRALVLCLNLCL